MKLMSMAAALNPIRKQNVRIAATLIGTIIATPAMAATDGNVTVIAVGSQMGTGGYIQIGSATSGGCPSNIIYVDTSTDAGRGILAIALTARASGRVIARIDYTGGGGAMCNATLIQL